MIRCAGSCAKSLLQATQHIPNQINRLTPIKSRPFYASYIDVALCDGPSRHLVITGLQLGPIAGRTTQNVIGTRLPIFRSSNDPLTIRSTGLACKWFGSRPQTIIRAMKRILMLKTPMLLFKDQVKTNLTESIKGPSWRNATVDKVCSL